MFTKAAHFAVILLQKLNSKTETSGYRSSIYFPQTQNKRIVEGKV